MNARILGLCLVLCSTAALAAPAASVPVSDQSVETLLSVMKVDAMIEPMYAGVEQAMKRNLQQVVAGQSLTAEQQRLMDAIPPKLMGVMREEFSWAKLRPGIIQVYKETFDQKEIDGLIGFYRSPVGQAYITKMPIAMQKSIALSQQQLQDILPKLRAAMDQALAEVRAAPSAPAASVP